MGFHPDFTGRQNAFMAGQLLGISNQDMVRLMPEIEAFAEIGDYIDQPVRVYSSGMQMRLAFSVATAIRPDILIVDEALSVGDAYFQHKSLDRIRRYQRDGMTLLLVSHDKQVIQNFCSRAILLDSGRVGVEGDPEKVMDLYDVSIRNLNNHHISVQSEKSGKARIDSGSKDMVIVSIDLRNLVGESVRTLSVGETYICVINARSMNFIENLILGFGVKDKYGQMIFGTNTLNLKKAPREINANELVVFEVSFVAALGLGSFSIHCSLIDKKNGTYNVCHWVDRALLFDVINIDKPDFVGVGWAEIDVTSPVFFVKRGCNE